jgi:hypothetical protein
LPVDVQYFPSRWYDWQPSSAAIASHPRHGLDDQYFERGQRHPLMVVFFDDGTDMWATLSYKPAFYSEETVNWLAGQLEAVLRAGAANPDEPLLSMLHG